MKITEKNKYLEIVMEKEKDVIKVIASNNKVLYIEFRNNDLILTTVNKSSKM